MSGTAGKWTTLRPGGLTRSWGSSEENLAQSDYVIVVAPGLNRKTLLTPTGTTLFSLVDNQSTYAPDNNSATNIVYGIDNVATARPFNRADYFIGNASTTLPVTIPQRCAPNTGVLVKAVISHSTGTPMPLLPLLDCVADMQVVFGLDTNGDRTVDGWTNGISGLTADTIRSQLAEIRVYILAQEGMRDDSYRTPTGNVLVGFNDPVNGTMGRDFSVQLYPNYRWKVYNIVVKPTSLAN